MPVNFFTEADRHRLNHFPHDLCETDLVNYFTLTLEDRQWVNQQRHSYNRLGFAVQLCSLRYLGFCPDDLSLTPSEVTLYLSQQLDIAPEALQDYGRRSQTRTQHLQLIRQYLGFRDAEEQDLHRLSEWLLERALEHDNPSLLFQFAAQQLYQARIVRPGVTTLERLVAQARASATQETYRRLQPLLTRSRREFLDQLLVYEPSLQRTRLNWLQRAAIANSPPAILNAIRKLEYLRRHGVHQWKIATLNPNRLKFLAQLAKKSSNQALQRSTAERRYPILVAFVCQMQIEITDEAMDLFIACLGETHARARRDVEAFRQREASAMNEKIILLAELGRLILDTTIQDEELRRSIYNHISVARLEGAIAECDRLIRPVQDEYYDYFAARYSYLRQFAPHFLNTFTFRSNLKRDPLLIALQLLHQLNVEHKRKVPKTAPHHFVSAKWKPFVFDDAGAMDRRYYELCVLWELRVALRSGNVWLNGSRRYANPESYLIPKEQWELQRTEVCKLLQITEQCEQRLNDLETQFNLELEQLQQTLTADTGIRLEQGNLVLSPLSAQLLPDSVNLTNQAVSSRLPYIHLTDLLIEIDQLTQFSQSLTHAGGRTLQDEDAKVYLYAAILAQSCNLGLKAMAQIADLSFERLLWYTHWYLREETLRPAINTIVNYQYTLPLSQIWGGGTLSSSDGQRFPIAVKNRQAVALPRYFGYGRGVTFYTWTSDQFSQFGDRVIPSTLRDATYLLDGIFDNETELTILEHTTDTAGYTEVLFALFDLVGLRFSPRIRDISDQTLYRLRSIESEELRSLLKGTINQELILERWDDLLRVAGSLKLGWVTASLFIGKLQSFPQQNTLLKAFQEYGRLIKTIFILRYLNHPDYRRRIQTQLNKGEAIHALRRFLLFARQGQLRQRHAEDLANQSSCLTLVTNAVITWNTIYLQAAIQQLQSEGMAISDEDLVHLSPSRYEHINPYGKYSFDIAQNQNRQGLRPLRPPTSS